MQFPFLCSSPAQSKGRELLPFVKRLTVKVGDMLSANDLVCEIEP
jgi:hypothetical protein